MNLKLLVILMIVCSTGFAQLKQRTIDEPMPSRQVHLDFHTSEFIPGIGEKFDKKQFQEALKIGHINSKMLAAVREPYFNRTYEKYSGHRATPYQLEDSQYPAVIQNGNVIWFAHKLDQMYYTSAVRLHRQLVENAIDLLYEKPLLAVKNLPSCGRLSFLKQEKDNRYVAHLLYAPALQRGEVMVIEDLLPVQGVEIEVNVPEKVKKVYQIQDGKKLDFKRKDNKLIVKVPTFTMHTGIVIEF